MAYYILYVIELIFYYKIKYVFLFFISTKIKNNKMKHLELLNCIH